jgi:hypothetical protein
VPGVLGEQLSPGKQHQRRHRQQREPERHVRIPLETAKKDHGLHAFGLPGNRTENADVGSRKMGTIAPDTCPLD